ncbi:ABC transporter permease [Oceanithermus sp.]
MRFLAIARSAFALSWREATAYRLNFAMSFLVIAVPFVLQVFLWGAVFSGRAQVAGYSLSGIITYYVLALFLYDFVQPVILYDVSNDIKTGTLAAHLLRPLPYPLWALTVRVGSQAVYLVVVTAIVGAGAVLLGGAGYLSGGDFSVAGLVRFFAVFLAAWLLGLLLSLAASFAVFFTEDAAGLGKLVSFVFPLLSGSLIPLDMLPGWIRSACYYLPFRWLVYEPIRVYGGQQPLAQALLAIAGWAGLAAALVWLLWRAGEARFTAVGG